MNSGLQKAKPLRYFCLCHKCTDSCRDCPLKKMLLKGFEPYNSTVTSQDNYRIDPY